MCDANEVPIEIPKHGKHAAHHAPESVTQKEFDEDKATGKEGTFHAGPADIWSFGVLVFHMLYKEMPFYYKVKHSFEVQWLVVLKKLGLQPSPHCFDLLKKTFDLNPAARPKSGDLLMHPFFNN